MPFLSEQASHTKLPMVPHHSPAKRSKTNTFPPFSKCIVLPEAISGLSPDIYSLVPGCGSGVHGSSVQDWPYCPSVSSEFALFLPPVSIDKIFLPHEGSSGES